MATNIAATREERTAGSIARHPLLTMYLIMFGVALPYLNTKYNNALMAALLISIPEFLLHAPDYFVSGMNFRKAVGALMFGIFTVALSVIFAWTFLNTKGSLLIVTLFHASGNAWSNLLTNESVQPFYYSIALIVIFAVAVAAINGPRALRQGREETTAVQ